MLRRCGCGRGALLMLIDREEHKQTTFCMTQNVMRYSLKHDVIAFRQTADVFHHSDLKL